MEILLPITKLLVFIALLAIAVVALMMPLANSRRATFAVMRRNFVGYFSSPTGYVFICVFMLLSSIAAFWPDEFFNDNLATLSQLNHWFPLIMLVFIPAITMSIWSEERREGTDELLLTIPATDFDIVMGKYLAAVAIFSVSLLLSMITNFLVLVSLALGDVDVGLFVTTYTGYWFIGLSMLSLGMVASFLTSNLTVGFILGALFNAPLAFLMYADRVIPQRWLAQDLSWWSYAARFADFGRGVMSFGSITFFVLLAAFGVYVSMIMIGRRHWVASNSSSMLGHYLVRTISLLVMVLAGSRFLAGNGFLNRIRVDATSGNISSLATDTKKLLQGLDPENGVLIEAFISRDMPQAFVNTRIDLINLLREFEALGGKNVEVRVYDDLEPFTEQATRAEDQYGITARRVTLQSRGGIRQEELFLGAAFTSGLQRVVIPFFEQGVPVEYELMRSIATVSKGVRKRIGVVKTDAQLFGGLDMQRMAQTPKQLIIEELEKQYEVEEVDPSQPMEAGAFDVLMVIQPSSLTQSAMENLVAVIRDGQPTAVFEDPLPVALAGAPATGEPRRPQGGGMFGMGAQPPEPKGNIRKLWDTLGIAMVGDDSEPSGPFAAQVVWQEYNPYGNKISHQQITPEWVFISPDAPGAQDDALNIDEAVTSGLSQLLLLYPGGIRNLGARDLVFTPLARTGDRTGTMRFEDLRQNQRDPKFLQFMRAQRSSKKRYVIAARIRGFLKDDLTMSDAKSPLLVAQATPGPIDAAPAAKDPSDTNIKAAPDEAREKEIHVVYVADIDLVSSEFLQLRAQPDPELNWDFDNVTFVLNILDSLAGDESLIDIRKRKTRHSTLKLVELKTEEARDDAMEEISEFDTKIQEALDAARERLSENSKQIEEKIAELQLKAQDDGQSQTPELVSEMTRLGIQQKVVAKKLQAETEKLERERDRRLQVIQNGLSMDVREVQTQYKLYAAFLPLIPPFIVGLLVWNARSKREKETVGSERLR